MLAYSSITLFLLIEKWWACSCVLSNFQGKCWDIWEHHYIPAGHATVERNQVTEIQKNWTSLAYSTKRQHFLLFRSAVWVWKQVNNIEVYSPYCRTKLSQTTNHDRWIFEKLGHAEFLVVTYTLCQFVGLFLEVGAQPQGLGHDPEKCNRKTGKVPNSAY